MRIKLQRLRQSSRSSSPTNTHSKDENETSGKIAIADVIAIYADDRDSEIARDKELYARLARLDNFWANRTLAEINGETCREYVRVRNNGAGARRELEDLRAAINHHSREGYHGALSAFSFPRKKGNARTRWLSRKEAAALLWAYWRARETQTTHRGPQTNKSVGTGRRPLRHIARFILDGPLYRHAFGSDFTASPKRERTIVRGPATRRSLPACRWRRRNQQAPAAIPLPPRLLAHLRRWATKGIIRNVVIEWNGQSVKDRF